MPRQRNTFKIDANAPIALVDVDNILDNELWKWCEDDIDARDATYTRFGVNPDEVVPAGTTVRMDYTWGYGKDGMTDPRDYVLTTPKDATMEYIAYVILSVYHGQMQNDFDGHGRFYYIEQTGLNEAGELEINFGT